MLMHIFCLFIDKKEIVQLWNEEDFWFFWSCRASIQQQIKYTVEMFVMEFQFKIEG